MVLVSTLRLLAQSHAGADSPPRLSKLTIVATDASGKAVTDLRLDELKLREDGEPRPITFFRFAGSPHALASHGPTDFANRPAPPPPLVILLDSWDDGFLDDAGGWMELSTAVQRLESAENVYVYFLTSLGEMIPVRPLPGPGVASQPAAGSSPAELRARLDEAVQRSRGLRSRDDSYRVANTLGDLEALLRQLSLIAGRKNLMWVTQGIPLMVRTPDGVTDLGPQLRKLSEMAARSQIAIYTEDESEAGGVSTILQMLPELTGGRSYPRDHSDRAIADALTDSRASYRIAYPSAAPEKDGREHKIHLDTMRKGVHVLTRGESVDMIPEPAPDQIEVADLSIARRSPFDAADIGLRVALSRKPAPSPVHFDIYVDPADLLIERSGEQYRATVDVLVALYGEGFFEEGAPPSRVDLTLTQAQLDRARKNGILVPLDVPVNAQIQKARVMVFDPRLLALGSVTMAIQ
jgi:VWFA-related protein